jgi:CTP synthase (UTP-ammonia lyase)
VTAHRAIPIALELAASSTGSTAQPTWVATDAVGEPARSLANFDGVWCVPASPYRSMDGALSAIRFARESGLPFLGTCGGFQHAVIEIARNVLHLSDADHAETNPTATSLVVTPLTCSLVEVTGEVVLDRAFAASLGSTTTTLEEGYHCSYGLNRTFVPVLENAGLEVVAWDADGEPRAVVLHGHPFFVATLFQPERSALQGTPHPIIEAFARSAIRHAAARAGLLSRFPS